MILFTTEKEKGQPSRNILSNAKPDQRRRHRRLVNIREINYAEADGEEYDVQEVGEVALASNFGPLGRCTLCDLLLLRYFVRPQLDLVQHGLPLGLAS